MVLLLDTHTLLWALSDSNQIPDHIKKMIDDEDNEICVSVASLWEIQIKHLKNPKAMPYVPDIVLLGILEAEMTVLEIDQNYILRLPEIVNQDIHRDPFDHIILATALHDEFTLITHDRNIAKYQGVETILY